MADANGPPGIGLRERKKQRTRSTLLDAALQLCDRQGFEGTTVDQIAAVADVSPRTFSRYFATKDAIAWALIDEAIDRAAVELARQPPELDPFDALLRSYVAMYRGTKVAAAGALSADRLMRTVRIIMTSPTLRQATLEYRPHAVNLELARRMGVDIENRTVHLVSAMWGAIVMTAHADLADDGTDWDRLGVDDIVARLQDTFGEFTGLMDGLRQAV